MHRLCFGALHLNTPRGASAGRLASQSWRTGPRSGVNEASADTFETLKGNDRSETAACPNCRSTSRPASAHRSVVVSIRRADVLKILEVLHRFLHSFHVFSALKFTDLSLKQLRGSHLQVDRQAGLGAQVRSGGVDQARGGVPVRHLHVQLRQDVDVRQVYRFRVVVSIDAPAPAAPWPHPVQRITAFSSC